MKQTIAICLGFIFMISCQKNNKTAVPLTCNIQQVYAENANKVTITTGVWGTVSSMEGNCMPSVPACNACCRHCPVKRTVRIYQYTTLNDAVTSDPGKGFFDSFTTPLVTELVTDTNGFYQVTIPAGQYSIVVIENGKLYANTTDGQGGLNPFLITAGTKNVDLTMTYKATF